MGNTSAKQKLQFIKDQQAVDARGKRGGGDKAIPVDDRIDDPNFEVLKEFPRYIEFFCPCAIEDKAVHEGLKWLLLEAKTLKTLSFAGVRSIDPMDLSVLLPLYAKNATQAQVISINGIVGCDFHLVTAALRVAPQNLSTLDIENTKLEFRCARALMTGLRQFAECKGRTAESHPLEVLAATGNPFFCDTVEGSKCNEQLASDIEELQGMYAITVRHPPIPETPFEINGQWFRISEVDEYRPVASTFVALSQYNFGIVDDGDAKADFLCSTVSAIIRAQRDPKRPEGLRYIPRLFHLQKYTKEFLTLVSENVSRQQNFVPIGQLFKESTASQWTVQWRMEIALQVAHVCAFLHTLNAGLREIFPLEILVDMQQKRIMYTQLGSLRPQGMVTRLHREVAGDRLRFADPAENNRTDFSLPKDLYSLAKLLMYFLVPQDNAKQFSASFQPPLNITQDLNIPTQAYLKQLDSRLPPDALPDQCKLDIAGLVAESTMKDEMRRPTSTAFASRLAAIIKEASK